MIFGAPKYKFRNIKNVAVPDHIVIMELVATSSEKKYDGVIVAIHTEPKNSGGNFQIAFEVMSIPVSLQKYADDVKIGRGRAYKDIKKIVNKLCAAILVQAIEEVENETRNIGSLYGGDDSVRIDGTQRTSGEEDSPSPEERVLHRNQDAGSV